MGIRGSRLMGATIMALSLTATGLIAAVLALRGG
jgi:hypothetical protein